MVKKVGFDTDKYLSIQKKHIQERLKRFDKLYLEFGGKLSYDLHASRVLPGYRPTAKIELLQQLNNVEIIYCVSTKDIEKGRIRADFGLTYDNQTLKDIVDIRSFGLEVNSVVITFYQGQKNVEIFKRKLENLGVKVYLHKPIAGYPLDIPKVLEGYLEQPYIETKNKIIIVTGTGPNSGKMATCLTQIYQERKQKIKSAFAKFETFPIWNLELEHPINIAYEAATADLLDMVMIDPFHQKAYNITSVNYNRDIENFDILISLMKEVTGENKPFGYRSPTDMGVNMVASGIIDDEVCREAAKQEIIRRYFRYHKEKIEGIETKTTLNRIIEIMKKVGLQENDRAVVEPARQAAIDAENKGKGNKGIFCGVAIELPNGKIITGKNSSLLHAESAAILNAIKVLAGVSDEVKLLPAFVIQDINNLKTKILGEKTESLNVEETLIALSVSASTNEITKKCLNKLKNLRNCEIHTTHILSAGDQNGLRKLGLNVTTDAKLTIKYF
ncbi:MAG: DUF1846 family protein [Candidatus Magasanikbacteria bacterium]|nr:DUF1846 family protein [Candidatus Magasanikbacteria bacterium]